MDDLGFVPSATLTIRLFPFMNAGGAPSPARASDEFPERLPPSLPPGISGGCSAPLPEMAHAAHLTAAL